jgi:uncharacterized protein (TIGR03067 family)
MRRLLLSAALTAAVLSSTTQATAAGEPVAGDLVRLKGSWAGKAGPGGDVPIVYTFDGDAVTIRFTFGGVNGREITLKGKVRLDESARPEKAIDWLNLSDSTGKSIPQQSGIYALDGDNILKLCNARDPKNRPDGFDKGVPTIFLTRLAESPRDAKGEETRGPAPTTPPCQEAQDDKKAEAPKGDLAKLQGTWSAKVGNEKNIEIAVTIKGTDVTLKIVTPEGQSIESKGQVKLDETAKPHKTVDWTKFNNPSNGEITPDNPGIYEIIDADTVRFCSGGPGNERPTEFKAGDGGQPSLVTLTRQKDKDAKPKEELKGDLARLQGDWTAMAGPEKNIPVKLIVKDKTVEVSFTTPNGDDRSMKGEFVLNETAKPKTIDFVKFLRPDGEEAPANLGIYTIEADSFTVCSGGPGNERPTEFKAGEGGPPNILVFTRKK